jgi:hypothetical protein
VASLHAPFSRHLVIMPVVVSTPAKVNVVGNVAVWNVLDV